MSPLNEMNSMAETLICITKKETPHVLDLIPTSALPAFKIAKHVFQRRIKKIKKIRET
jgi:hypothetical protein